MGAEEVIVFRLFGFEVLALGCDCHADGLSDLPRYELTAGEFERDTEPLRANHEEPYYEEDRFGFR